MSLMNLSALVDIAAIFGQRSLVECATLLRRAAPRRYHSAEAPPAAGINSTHRRPSDLSHYLHLLPAPTGTVVRRTNKAAADDCSTRRDQFVHPWIKACYSSEVKACEIPADAKTLLANNAPAEALRYYRRAPSSSSSSLLASPSSLLASSSSLFAPPPSLRADMPAAGACQYHQAVSSPLPADAARQYHQAVSSPLPASTAPLVVAAKRPLRHSEGGDGILSFKTQLQLVSPKWARALRSMQRPRDAAAAVASAPHAVLKSAVSKGGATEDLAEPSGGLRRTHHWSCLTLATQPPRAEAAATTEGDASSAALCCQQSVDASSVHCQCVGSCCCVDAGAAWYIIERGIELHCASSVMMVSAEDEEPLTLLSRGR